MSNFLELNRKTKKEVVYQKENYIMKNGKPYTLEGESLELVDRKTTIKKQMKELEMELELIDIELNERLHTSSNIEVCDVCTFFYIGRSETVLPFGHRFETLSDSPTTIDCVCGNTLHRHSSFISALDYINSETCKEHISQNFKNELSAASLKYIVDILPYISVPSFVVEYDKSYKKNKEWKNVHKELLEKDFIRIVEALNTDHFTLVVNARKLNLYPDNNLFNEIKIQNKFKTSYLSTINVRSNRIKNLPNTFTDEQKQLVLDRFNNRCAFTGEETSLHLDHVIPIAWEIEGTVVSNMLPLSASANSSKHDSNVFEWYEKKGRQYNVKEDLFIVAITYIAELNNMSFDEYKQYVYDCEKSKRHSI